MLTLSTVDAPPPRGFARLDAGVQKAREVVACVQFGDAQVNLPLSRLPNPPPVAISLRLSFQRALIFGCSRLDLYFHLNHHLAHDANTLFVKILVLVQSQLAQVPLNG